MDILNKFFAGVIAISCGIVAFAATYYLLGFVLNPIRDFLVNKVTNYWIRGSI